MTLTNSGNIETTLRYDVFGKKYQQSGTFTPRYTFSTKEYLSDAILYLYAYRGYDPIAGRWTQRDPIGYQDSENLYQFCGNNPVNAIDILGLKAHTYTCTYDHNGGIEVAKKNVENPDNNPLYKGKESDINSETGLPIARTFSSKKELIEKIKKDAENDGEAVSVTIIAHGRQGSIRTGRKERIKTEEEFKNLADSLNGNVMFIDFLCCEVMGTPSGRKKGVILATHANSPVI